MNIYQNDYYYKGSFITLCQFLEALNVHISFLTQWIYILIAILGFQILTEGYERPCKYFLWSISTMYMLFFFSSSILNWWLVTGKRLKSHKSSIGRSERRRTAPRHTMHRAAPNMSSRKRDRAFSHTSPFSSTSNQALGVPPYLLLCKAHVPLTETCINYYH